VTELAKTRVVQQWMVETANQLFPDENKLHGLHPNQSRALRIIAACAPAEIIDSAGVRELTAQHRNGQESLLEFVRRIAGRPQLDAKGQIYQVGAACWDDGFEAAHELRPCGHSRGDYRDAGYVPGQPKTYTASERCVGCERVRELTEALEQVITWAYEHPLDSQLQAMRGICEAVLARCKG
jgi:hypothetical protein